MKIGLCLLTVLSAVGCGSQAAPPSLLNEPSDAGDARGDEGLVVDSAPPAIPQTLSISEVAVFQAVKIDLARDGAVVAAHNAPVIAGRPALFRVYVAPDAGWKSHSLVGELHLHTGGKDLPLVSDTKIIGAASKDADLKSTFDFSVPAEAMGAGTTYWVGVHPAKPLATPEEATARYPVSDGADDIGALTGAEQVRIKIVPIRYDADGSGRTPDVTSDQLLSYQTTIFGMYPTAKVEVTLHAPLPFATAITADGTGFDDLLQAVIDVRSKDGAPDDVYYVAAVEPEATLEKFCGGGCVLGVAPQIGPGAIGERVAAITGYPSDYAIATLSQELAHAMGRGHAPCGNPGAIDKKFPYPDGSIGGFGYDLLGAQLINPGDGWSDFMSYCQPTWVSDYTYAGLYKRIAFVNGAVKKKGPPAAMRADAPRPYHLFHVGGDGSLQWGRTVMLSDAPDGARADVSFENVGGAASRASGDYFPYDTIPGGLLVMAATDAPTATRALHGTLTLATASLEQ